MSKTLEQVALEVPADRIVPAETALTVPGLDMQSLFALVIEKAPDKAEALERLVALYDQQQRRNAELEFAKALAAFQDTCPPIPRTSTAKIATRTGAGFEYRYADFEQIIETIRPHLRENGLSFTFDSKVDGAMLVCTGVLRHVNGHSIASSFTLPTASQSAMSEQQKVGAALTFAKRQVLASLLGLALTDPDPDHETDKTPISNEQLANLNALIGEVKADVARFLAYLRVDNLAALPASRYGEAIAALEAKRKGR
jgi:ERF superfamily protein